jgi:hypothetical protein
VDYSDYLTKGRLEAEMVAWKQARFHVAYAYDIASAAKEAGLSKPAILELGCGPSLIPAELDIDFTYKGVDKFPLCITKARLANPDHEYEEIDIRDFHAEKTYDIVCAFAFLKHFTLEELPVIMSKMLKSGNICIFSIPIGDTNKDDLSNGFPHTFVTLSYLKKIVKSYGFKIVATNESIGPVEPVFVVRKLNVERPKTTEKATAPKKTSTAPKKKKGKK